MSAAEHNPYELVPLDSRWYAWGRHSTVVEHGVSNGEYAVGLHRDGEPKPEPHLCPVRSLLRKGVPSENGNGRTTPPSRRMIDAEPERPTGRRTERSSMATKAAGPKEAEAREQREAKASNGAKPASSKRKKGGTSAIEAIVAVLSETNKPMPVPEIITAAIPKATGLRGKHPRQTMYSVLYSEAKRKSPRVVQVGKGKFKVAS